MVRFALLAILLLTGNAVAQDWHAVTTELIKTDMPGYGGLRAFVVNHSNGDLFLNLSDKGIYRSADLGKTWKSVNAPVKGRGEAPGGLLLDPIGGKRLVAAFIYGSAIAVSPDLGTTWKELDKKASHVDWCAVDWTDPDMKFILTLKHESGGLLLASHDGGLSFEEVGKGYGSAWVFDNKTAVVAEMKSKDKPMPRLMRTTDAGKNFAPVADANVGANVLPRWRKDTLYWLTDGSLITSADLGKTWKNLSAVKDGRFGPIFGKDDQLFVLTASGILESRDGGATWGKPFALPRETKATSPQTWIEYDPGNDILYARQSGTDLYQWNRRK